MKKALALILAALLCLTLFGCRRDGDLGKQTTVDTSNGYTVVPEVIPFQYKVAEKEMKNNKNARKDGFKVTKENSKGEIKTKTDALEIAKQETDVKYNYIRYGYDRTRGIWRITFSVSTTTDESTEEKILETVYVDEDGYTVAAVK